MVKLAVSLVALYSALALCSPVEVTDSKLVARAAGGFGKERNVERSAPVIDIDTKETLHCGTDGEIIASRKALGNIPDTGECQVNLDGCTQYTCYTEDSIHGGVKVCGRGGAAAGYVVDCSAIYSQAQEIISKCASGASLLEFIGGTVRNYPISNGEGGTASWNVTIGNFGSCASPRYNS